MSTLNWSVPVLDWSNPATPTLARKGPQVSNVRPKIISYDIYVNIIDFYPAFNLYAGILDRRPPPFVPAAPADDMPPVWQYEFSLLTFRRWCLRKGMLPPSFSYYHKLSILTFRGFAAFWFIWTVLWGFVDYYACFREVWLVYQARRNGLPIVFDDELDDDAWFDDDAWADDDDAWEDDDDAWEDDDDAEVDDDDAWVTDDEDAWDTDAWGTDDEHDLN